MDWTAEELKALDKKTRKLMTMNGALHPGADVDRLYVIWEEGKKAGC